MDTEHNPQDQNQPSKDEHTKSTEEATVTHWIRFDRQAIKTGIAQVRRMSQSYQRNTRVFASVDHLNPEAVAAFVDGELTPSAAHRARIHLVHCYECREEIKRQQKASERLRLANNENMCAPSELITRLCQIAQQIPHEPSEETKSSYSQNFIAKIDQVSKTIINIHNAHRSHYEKRSQEKDNGASKG
ncbi:anti-sigma factor [Corynebacterium sp. sy039]|uniref:anti-sigma factor family protein n=1 Tax=Corynebacterium sp. sy039 TaxID=2599641 RepID=UPI001FED89D6|nr:zf-HC2 domain-containing protein [Corynebacterium sp. sy039]